MPQTTADRLTHNWALMGPSFRAPRYCRLDLGQGDGPEPFMITRTEDLYNAAIGASIGHVTLEALGDGTTVRLTVDEFAAYRIAAYTTA